MDTGVSHCEWFRRADGSVAISEIAARPPGAQITTMISRAHDIDFVKAWAALQLYGTFDVPGAQVRRRRGVPARAGARCGDGPRRARCRRARTRAPSSPTIDCRHAGQMPTGSYEGEGFIVLRHPDTEVVVQRPAPTRLHPARPPRLTPSRRRASAGACACSPLTLHEFCMAPNVLMIMPGFPGEMPFFTRGLSEVGATVWGVAPGHVAELPAVARRHLSQYLSVPSLFTDERAAIDAIREWTRGVTIDRVCCLWEPGVELAAAIREALGTPGQSREQALRFRNKELMKQALGAAGVRVPGTGRRPRPRPCASRRRRWAFRASSSRSPVPARRTRSAATPWPRWTRRSRSSATSTR
jgi:hypothetical protein